MKKIKIKFVDFWPGFNEEDNYFIELLKKKYDVQIHDNPDYIIYSVFGKKHLEYECIRILYVGENMIPNFNECDYAIGYYYIDFEDRYIRMPLSVIFRLKNLELALSKHNGLENESVHNKKFCNFIYSNGEADRIREEFFYKLSDYRKVDSGGRYINNIGQPVEDKLEFQKEYKFSIAFENSCAPGYTTEKIIDAFAAKTIPIYWGNPKISEDINEKAFINCHEYNNIDEVIELVKKIDSDNELYKSYLAEPIFKEERIPYKLSESYLEKFLFNIFDQNISDASRRCSWWFEKNRNKLENQNDQYRKYYLNSILKSKKIIGWGAGAGLEILKTNSLSYDINFEYLIDGDEAKHNTNKNGLSIYSPNKILTENPDEIFIIVLSCNYYNEIKNKLLDYGFKEVEQFVCFNTFMGE